MKKIFFLAATMVAAMAMNAASFVGFDARTTALGEQINAGGLITDLVNATMSCTDEAALKYSIFAETAGTEGSFKIGGIKMAYMDSQNNHKEIVKTYGTYLQPNGSRRTITIPTIPGEKVDIFVVDACAGVLVEGAGVSSIDLVAYGEGKDVPNTLTATGLQIVLTTDGTKPKFAAILPASATGLEGVRANAAFKANKMIVNGRMYVRNAHNAWVNVLGF